ncbi:MULTISPECIES: polysaccharide biosynthesis tyrosine autokinase [unclassified Sphingomonas]|uniref:polysaccharide biosynthesis tyrosine autokinase n=1 Tax=unclassified Sphingomonas TaxID=196159 RepID=UPI00138F19A1|nr:MULTISPECIES: polysaccharide biosynthesis tyrosine autokinase [unclassified Sphingomonas]
MRTWLAVLRRRWQVLAACVVTITLLTLLAVFQVTPRYSATSSVAINTQKTQIVDATQVVSDVAADISVMETQATILHSPTLIGKLIDKLHLDRDPEFSASAKASMDAAKPSFDIWKPSSWFASTVDQVSLTPAARKKTPLEEARDRSRLIDVVSAAVDVRIRPRSYVLTITATSENASKAAVIANTLAELFIADQIETKYDATRRASVWLESRVAELKSAAVAADQAASSYRAATGLVGGSGGSVDSQQLSEINSALILARVARAEKAAQLGQIRRLTESGAGLEASAATLESPLIQSLRQQEAEVLRKLSELKTTFAAQHPKIINANAELRDLREKIADEVRKIGQSTANDLAVASAREAALASSMASARSRTGASSMAEVRLRELERQADAAKTLYETFLNRAKETREQVGIQTPDARIVSQAIFPLAASYPKKGKTVTTAVLLSILLGFGLIVLLERLENTIRNPDYLEKLSDSPVLSLVPLADEAPSIPEDIVLDSPLSQTSESLRTLRNALSMVDVDTPPKIIMVTSSLPGEGKTFLSSTLARSALDGYRRILLIDGDLRRPRIHKVFELENRAGLSDVVSGAVSFEDAVQHDPRAKVDILTAGRRSPSPMDLLRSQQMSNFLRQMRERYDLVIVDTPPFGPLADAQIIAKLVDKIVLVVRWGETPIPVLRNILSQMARLQAPLAGTVLTQVNMRRYAAYGYGDYGYYYHRYGSYSYGAEA